MEGPGSLAVFADDRDDASQEMLDLPDHVCSRLVMFLQRILVGKVDCRTLQPICPAWNGVEAFLATMGPARMIYAVERLAPDGEVVVTILEAARDASRAAPAAVVAADRLRRGFP